VLAGRFHDGRTAASRPVSVHASDGGWEIRGDDGTVLRFWRRPDIGAAEALPTGGVRVTCRAEPDAVLVLPRLPDAATAAAAAKRHRRAFRLGIVGAVAAVAAMAGLAAALPHAGRVVAELVPQSVERRLGDGIARNIEHHGRPCRAADGKAAMTTLVTHLAAALPEQRRPRRVIVVDMEDANAVALPGGTIIVFRGLLAAAADADEVAGVLAHEMTHVALRHPMAGLVRNLGVAVLVALVVGDTSGVVASGATLALANAYSREDEDEADRGALRLLAAAGIGSDGLAGFFHRAARTDRVPRWLSDHPQAQARAAALDAARVPGREPALPPEQWAALASICR